MVKRITAKDTSRLATKKRGKVAPKVVKGKTVKPVKVVKPVKKSKVVKTAKIVKPAKKAPNKIIAKKQVKLTPKKGAVVKTKKIEKKPAKKSVKPVIKKPVATKAASVKKPNPILNKLNQTKMSNQKPVSDKSSSKTEQLPPDASLKKESVKIKAQPKISSYQAKKGEEYMNEKQLDHFRGILHRWKAELLEEIERTVSHMKDEAANFPDPNDRATQEEEFSLELRTRDRERKLIPKIDEALDRIKLGDYGYCEACGIEIGVQRLEARPTATLCIDCKTLEEIREKQVIG